MRIQPSRYRPDRFRVGFRPGAAIGTRINIRKGDPGKVGSGLLYALRNHGGSGPAGKSQFSIPAAEIIALLRRPDVIRSPARSSPGSPNFIREVDVGRVIGHLPLNRGGRPTQIITVLTDRLGSLANIFPGRLARKATFDEEAPAYEWEAEMESGPRPALFWHSLAQSAELLRRSRLHLAQRRMRQARAALILARRRLVISGKSITPAIYGTQVHTRLAPALVAVNRAGAHLLQNRPAQAMEEMRAASGLLQNAMRLALQAPITAKA